MELFKLNGDYGVTVAVVAVVIMPHGVHAAHASAGGAVDRRPLQDVGPPVVHCRPVGNASLVKEGIEGTLRPVVLLGGSEAEGMEKCASLKKQTNVVNVLH